MSDLARQLRELAAVFRRVAPTANRLAALHTEYEAERAAAHFEGRVPPSPEVFYAGCSWSGKGKR